MDTTTIAETMERDIARLKSARPRLTSRIERAEHILVAQLCTANGSRPVKVRVHADGSRSYTVRSGSRLRRSYRVDPAAWSCSCPDHTRRRGQRSSACKHAPGVLGTGEGLRVLSGLRPGTRRLCGSSRPGKVRRGGENGELFWMLEEVRSPGSRGA
jgi:hypothetical protein